jgi:hypothetical protein
MRPYLENIHHKKRAGGVAILGLGTTESLVFVFFNIIDS